MIDYKTLGRRLRLISPLPDEAFGRHALNICADAVIASAIDPLGPVTPGEDAFCRYRRANLDYGLPWGDHQPVPPLTDPLGPVTAAEEVLYRDWRNIAAQWANYEAPMFVSPDWLEWANKPENFTSNDTNATFKPPTSFAIMDDLLQLRYHTLAPLIDGTYKGLGKSAVIDMLYNHRLDDLAGG